MTLATLVAGVVPGPRTGAGSGETAADCDAMYCTAAPTSAGARPSRGITAGAYRADSCLAVLSPARRIASDRR